MKKIIITLLTIITILSCNSYSKKKEGLEIKNGSYSARLDQRYKNYDDSKNLGYGILIMKDGVVEHSAGYGMANFEEKYPITPQVAFYSWSLYNNAIKISILNLWEDNQIDLNDSITKYITSLPSKFEEITIKMLLNRTSGLAGFVFEDNEQAFSSEDVINKFIVDQDFLNKPGTVGSFEGGFAELCLLTVLIEGFSGNDITDYLNDNFYKPLGMENSATLSPEDISLYKNNNFLTYYKRRPNGFVPDVFTGDWVVGENSTITTLEDIAKFYSALDSKTKISEKVYKKYNAISIYSDGTEAYDENNEFKQYWDGYLTPAGYLSIDKDDGLRATSYGNEYEGCVDFPDSDYRVFVVTNLDKGDASNSIFDKIFPILKDL